MRAMEDTKKERQEVLRLYRDILTAAEGQLSKSDIKDVHELLKGSADRQEGRENEINPVLRDLNTVYLTVKEIGMGRATIISVMAFDAFRAGIITQDEIAKRWGADVAKIVQGLTRASELYKKGAAVETENFRKLLLSMAEDVRVIFILIAERVYLMRNLERFDEDRRQKIAREASYLYAPMAHRMGLYKLKTELEDLSLKWLSPDIYEDIVRRLKETQVAREKYIADFINPLKKRLQDEGFDFTIKGRTKSIYSIWNKIKKKGTPFENIYDIFAIRVILNSKPEKEKADCWQVYSIVTEKYQPNPQRLRDWLSIPKSNGYESLHTTVMGPEGKWVEVQIRTRRMDEIAEKGLAAHWKYKGIKGEEGMDAWLKNLREILENPEKNAADFVDDFKLDLYDDDVFVFTPDGELKKLKQGSTVLDFAFNIHSNIGARCVGAKVNGKAVPIRHVLSNGDQVEVLTSPNQQPKQDWLDIVRTSKAKTKIKQALREVELKRAEEGREILERKLKNWKEEWSDSSMAEAIKHYGLKSVFDFYQAIANEKIDLQQVREFIARVEKPQAAVATEGTSAFSVSGEDFTRKELEKSGDDALVIDESLSGIEYKLSKCCHPIYGDKIFGFVSSSGGVKIHRMDCPNAPQLISKYGYRIVKARWAGKAGSQYPIALRITGKDDIAIVTNITSMLSKESGVTLRSFSVDSQDGVFHGHVTVLVNDLNQYENLRRKIASVKGVMSVDRN